METLTAKDFYSHVCFNMMNDEPFEGVITKHDGSHMFYCKLAVDAFAWPITPEVFTDLNRVLVDYDEICHGEGLLAWDALVEPIIEEEGPDAELAPYQISIEELLNIGKEE